MWNKPLSYYNCACAKISVEFKIGDKQTVNFSSSERTNFEVDGLFISNFELRPDLRACACAVVIGKGLIHITVSEIFKQVNTLCTSFSIRFCEVNAAFIQACHFALRMPFTIS